MADRAACGETGFRVTQVTDASQTVRDEPPPSGMPARMDHEQPGDPISPAGLDPDLRAGTDALATGMDAAAPGGDISPTSIDAPTRDPRARTRVTRRSRRLRARRRRLIMIAGILALVALVVAAAGIARAVRSEGKPSRQQAAVTPAPRDAAPTTSS
jgi:hypothetical protein